MTNHLAVICSICYNGKNGIRNVTYEMGMDNMKTAETINIACSELGITKAELAKKWECFHPLYTENSPEKA